MPTITQIDSFTDVCQVIMWTFVIWSVAQAVFRSFPAAELLAVMKLKPQRSREMQQLMWELRNRTAWDPRLAKGDQLVEPQTLSEDAMADRAGRLQTLQRNTLPARMLAYLLSCVFCQNVWVSLVLVGVFTSWQSVAIDVIPTALAYAGLTTVGLGMVTGVVPRATSRGERVNCPNGNCGERG